MERYLESACLVAFTQDKPLRYILTILEDFRYREECIKTIPKDNFNLLEEMENNQAIFIKLPEDCFATADERDIMATYWLSKIWLAAQVRASMIPDRYKRKTVTVITDEIAQLEASKVLGFWTTFRTICRNFILNSYHV